VQSSTDPSSHAHATFFPHPMQDSAVAHYRSFLATAECAAAAHDEAAAALGKLDALADDLPALAAVAGGFNKSAAALLAKKARNKQLQGAQAAWRHILWVQIPASGL